MGVVDASVVIKWHIEEADSEAAQSLRRTSERFAIPDLLFVETATVVWKNVRRGLMSPARAMQITNSIVDGPFDVYSNQALARDAVRIAIAREITPYDASYIALAISLRTDCVTADRKLFSKLRGSPFGRHVALLADYTN
ncbi:MAG: type II toxin-antitoxin system VapC family toxin [Acidobacteriota bacterium]|nr:type II toxin-antitoxin system VapC family toxin [Acidobacteriota bacterium]